jgi:hypothetical protein
MDFFDSTKLVHVRYPLRIGTFGGKVKTSPGPSNEIDYKRIGHSRSFKPCHYHGKWGGNGQVGEGGKREKRERKRRRFRIPRTGFQD